MNRKLFSIVLCAGLTASVIVAQDGQRPPAREAGNAGPRVRLLPRGADQALSLTGEQRNEMAAIETEARTKIEGLLTPEQKEKLATLRSAPPPVAERNRRGSAGDGGPGSADLQGAIQSAPVNAQPRPSETAESESGRPQRSLPTLPDGVTRLAVAFSGGYDTLPVDHGRPVVLVAAALGVPDEVFREAFSHVHPAGPGRGGPTDGEARANKEALMSRLGQYGVTNDRLNTVSNFYRYASWKGAMWRNKPATANALVKDGAIVGYEIVSGGYGYTTTPNISVPGMEGAAAKVELSYGKDFESNGAVSAITIPPSK